MRYLYLLLFVLVGAALAVVVVNNASPIQIAFFTWQSPELPVGVVMAGAVIVGAILLYLITTVSALQDWHELRQLRDRVRSLEGRVAALGQQKAGSQVGQMPPVAQPPMMQMPGLGLPPRPSGPLPDGGQRQDSGPLPNSGK